MQTFDRAFFAALSALILIHTAMLMSLYADVDPHPPATLPLFGMAPFLSAMLAAGVAAMILGVFETRAGTVLAALAALMALVSFGPHKFFDPAFPLIWPAFATANLSVATLIVRYFRHHQSDNVGT